MKSRTRSATFLSVIFKGIVVVFTATMLFSCENDMMAVVKLTAKDSIPDITIHSIFVRESENGKMKMELTAPKMISFQHNDAYTEFPNGLRVVFYDSLRQPESEVTANYGISWDNKRLLQARGNVIVKNFTKREQLSTETLNWDQNIKKISTTDFVKITTPDKTILGKGMESNELFSNWKILNGSGVIYVEEGK